jgi:hypothetical protein
MAVSGAPVFVCYVPGLDERLIDEQITPYLSNLRSEYQVVPIGTLPSTELVPTLVSGTLPHEHKIWQVSLRPEYRTVANQGLADVLPDLLVTTGQCTRHFFDKSYDLAAIPWRRRRRFELHRFKYTRRATSDEAMQEFSGFRTIFGLLGENSKYLFTKDFNSLPALSESLPTGHRFIEFLELYALDLVQHWNLGNVEVMNDALARTDQFIRTVHARCRQRDVRFLLLVDHGQERVVGTVPLLHAVKQARVPETEYSCFVELASARFWFHTERARRRLLETLACVPHTTILSWQDMHNYQVCFDDDAFGELYVFADAGRIFFPHDFYHPIGNSILGLLDWHQQQRIRNPVHRGNHGYLPHYPSERGWIVVDDSNVCCHRPEAQLADIAPTILSLTGYTPPSYMKGAAIYTENATTSDGPDGPR